MRICESNGHKIAIFDITGDFTDAIEDEFSDVYQIAKQSVVKHIIIHFDSEGDILSSGIAMLIGLIRHTEAKGQQCYAVGLSAHFTEVFEMTGLTKYIQIFPSEQEILASLS